MASTLYSVLGLSSSATMEEVKKIGRKMVLKFHPDKNPDGDRVKGQQVVEAFSTLKDEKTRQAYDLKMGINVAHIQNGTINSVYFPNDASKPNSTPVDNGVRSRSSHQSTEFPSARYTRPSAFDHFFESWSNGSPFRTRPPSPETAAFFSDAVHQEQIRLAELRKQKMQEEAARRKKAERQRQKAAHEERRRMKEQEAKLKEELRRQEELKLQQQLERLRKEAEERAKREAEEILRREREREQQKAAQREQLKEELVVEGKVYDLCCKVGFTDETGAVDVDLNQKFQDLFTDDMDKLEKLKIVYEQLLIRHEKMLKKEEKRSRRRFGARNVVIDLTAEDEQEDEEPQTSSPQIPERGNFASHTPESSAGGPEAPNNTKHGLETELNGRPSSKRARVGADALFNMDEVEEVLPDDIPEQHNPKRDEWFARGAPGRPTPPLDRSDSGTLREKYMEMLKYGEHTALQLAEKFRHLQSSLPNQSEFKMPQPEDSFMTLIEHAREPMREMSEWFEKLIEMNNYCSKYGLQT